MKAKNHPGVYLPPPLIYVAIFFCSILADHIWPLAFFPAYQAITHLIGWIVIALSVVCAVCGLWKFFRTRNTLITIKPARSLQTNGIYAYTRNPMYLGLLLLYTGIAFFKGNLWTFLFIPVLILIIQNYVIMNEEKYLERAFNSEYLEYKRSVRRWI